MESQEPVIETVVATVADIDQTDIIVGYDPDGEDDEKSTFEKVVDAGAVASHVVALGATKFAGVAGPAIAKGVEKAAPVVQKGAKYTAKGAVKLTTVGLRSLGKGLSALGSKLKPTEQEPEEIEYVTVPSEPGQAELAALPAEPGEIECAALPAEPEQVGFAALPAEPEQAEYAIAPSESEAPTEQSGQE